MLTQYSLESLPDPLCTPFQHVNTLLQWSLSIGNFKKYASAHAPYIFNGTWNDVMGVSETAKMAAITRTYLTGDPRTSLLTDYTYV